MMLSKLLPLLGLYCCQIAASTPYTLTSFDAQCGTVAGYNCRHAFQAAFAALATAGGGTLQLPAANIFIDFPDVSNNQTWGVPLVQSKLLVVPPNTAIVGATTPDGAPATTIQWAITSIPLFIFNKADHSSMANIHAVFVGSQPTYYPYGDVYLLKALGYNPTFPHWNQMSGGNMELFAFIYEFDSDGCTYDNFLAESATKDNSHAMNLLFNLKGKGVIASSGGGLTDLSSDNSISNVTIRDSLGAMLISGQAGLTIRNVTSNWRASLAGTAPGHLIYTTLQNVFDSTATVVQVVNSTNLLLEDIVEGPDTYSNIVAGGTLAIKGVNGGIINNITSSHPEGLIQTIYAAQNLLFTNMTWVSSYDLCGNVPSNCITPTIYSTSSSAPYLPIKNVTFQNVVLRSTITPTNVVLMGDNVQVHGMSIQVPPTFLPNQTATNAVLNIKGSNGGSVTNYSYTPLLSSYTTTGKYNKPFVGWGECTNIVAEITVNWPSTLPTPNANSTILSVGFQNQSSTANNTATETLVTY
jgi:hypothetical protein